MTSSTPPGKHVRRRLRIGGIAAIAPTVAVALAVLLGGTPLTSHSSHHRTVDPSTERVSEVSRDGAEHGKPEPSAAPAAPPKPVAGTHLMVDLASAPSLRTVQKWQKHSPYRAIGVYVPVAGGVDDRHDKVQKHLTPWWVTQVQAGGWRVLPIYLGAQAPRGCQSGRFHAISADPIAAQREGIAAADDAARSTAALGLTNVPVMYDMEGYRDGCSATMQAFFLGWTARLHQLGRLAGIYGAPSSAARDLLAIDAGGARPDVLWAATDNGAASTALRELPRSAWKGTRGNQFALDVVRRYGHKTMHVDDSAVDDQVWALRRATGAAAGPDTVAPVLTVATAPGTTVVTHKLASVRWTAVDQVSARVTYQTQVRRTSTGKPAAPWSAPAAAGHAQPQRLWAGEQECVRVRATDAAGNATAWTKRCTVRLADDRALQHGHGWHRIKQHGALHGKVLAAKRKHAKLTLGPTAGGRLGVVVQGRGGVTVRLDGHKVGVLHAGGLGWVRLKHAGTVTLEARAKHVAVDAYAMTPR